MSDADDLPDRVERVLDKRAKKYVGVRHGDRTYTTGRGRVAHDRPYAPDERGDLPAFPGAGALRSTVADILVYLRAQLGDAPAPLATAIRTTHEPRARRGKLEIGLGWFRLPLRGSSHRVLWHDGGTGGSYSVAGFVPELDLAVAVFTNTARPVDRIASRSRSHSSLSTPGRTVRRIE